jgi:predicted phage-related endonuclease
MDLKSLLAICDSVPINGMTYESWLDKRREFIGGSDAGAIMELAGNFGSPWTVYWQKKGVGNGKEMSRAAMRGKLLEPVIFKHFAEDYPSLVIEKLPYIMVSKTRRFMGANVDGIISGAAEIDGVKVEGLGILEIKTSKSGFGYSETEVNDSHFAQVQHYMSVLGLQWAVISVYMLETEEIKNYVIPRNDKFIDGLITKEKALWEENVLKNIPPAAIGIPAEDDMVTGMYDGSETTLTLTEEEKELCRQISSIKEQIKPLEKQEDALKIDLKTKLAVRAKPSKTNKKLSAIGGLYSISWSFIEQNRVDNEALKKAGLYDQFLKSTEYDRLTITVKKVS